MPETITRLCGHAREFTPQGDAYDERRREKIRNKRCQACAEAKNRADNEAAKAQSARRVKKGQELKLLPAGAEMRLVCSSGGRWVGSLTVHHNDTAHSEANGLMALVSKLARKWLKDRGEVLAGQVKD